ncbi:hypothetical protein [Streptomyces anulatus]|uniref:hypothetical protein n=1 Tax=Streptomyces anulatus TaxID=1892 RepID=UPI00364C6BFF|nr:hypothetical protein OHB50_39080 [Streptomyces anulatus]
MDWLNSLAPILTPVCALAGMLGGAWMVHRQAARKNDTEEKTSESTIFASAVTTVTNGFTGLLEQSRATNAETLQRMAALEGRHLELERKVETLQEEQRQWRRWKAAAVDYIHQLRDRLAKLSAGPPPAPPREIAEDLGDDESGPASDRAT